jgi:hypothetical protein
MAAVSGVGMSVAPMSTTAKGVWVTRQAIAKKTRRSGRPSAVTPRPLSSIPPPATATRLLRRTRRK